MKNCNFIFESEGIVNGNMQWIRLCDVIIMYMWDLEDGIANKISDSNKITKKDIEVYLENRNNKSSVMPEWIGDFTIFIKESDYKSNGSFLKRDAILKNNKLEFQINLKDRHDKEMMHDTLIHEFRHAYQRYIQLLKGFKDDSKKSQHNNKIYAMALKGFAPRINVVKSYSVDNIVVDESLLQDPNTLSTLILLNFYFINDGEVNSYLQEFHSSMTKILYSHKEQIIKDIENANKFRGNFNTVIDEEKWKANILNNISITPYASRYYRLYKGFQLLIDKLKYVDIDIATESFKQISREVKTFLNIPIAKALTHNDSETLEVLNKLSEKIKKPLDFVILKMNRIYAREIINFEEDNF